MNLPESLEKEIERIEKELIPQYEIVGWTAKPAVFLMRRARKTLVESDAVGQIKSLAHLQGFKV